jgi:Domain of unknown function (DUF4287)/Domain of unknown function (DUF5655)
VPSTKPQRKEYRVSPKVSLDNIDAKTGKTSQRFVDLERSESLLKPGVTPGQIVSWLKTEHGLGLSHSMAIVATIKQTTQPARSDDEQVSTHFSGKKSGRRPIDDKLVEKVSGFGSDTDLQAGASSINLRSDGKKFASVHVTADRLDGIKRKEAPAQGRLESAGSWNAIVTHRVRIHSAKEVNQEFYAWLKSAYAEIAVK